jgi:hypothetical protein
VRAKPLGQGGLGRLGDDGHALHIAGPDIAGRLLPAGFRAGSVSPYPRPRLDVAEMPTQTYTQSVISTGCQGT